MSRPGVIDRAMSLQSAREKISAHTLISVKKIPSTPAWQMWVKVITRVSENIRMIMICSINSSLPPHWLNAMFSLCGYTTSGETWKWRSRSSRSYSLRAWSSVRSVFGLSKTADCERAEKKISAFVAIYFIFYHFNLNLTIHLIIFSQPWGKNILCIFWCCIVHDKIYRSPLIDRSDFKKASNAKFGRGSKKSAVVNKMSW